MKFVQTVVEMQSFQSNSKVILVPTMGALHEGHASLIKIARDHAGADGTVIVSIFVNPTQFDREDDFITYPNTIDSDLAVAESAGADIVFSPKAEDMYSSDRSISVTESLLSANLCGATRPGHFDGVCLVCTKLFLITSATHAVFGEKDYQQLAIIRRLVKDLHLPVTILPVETVREDSGLALSSRNLNLSEEHKKFAPAVFQGLNMAKQEHAYGVNDCATLIALVSHHLSQLPIETKIDYLDIVDGVTLEKLTTIEDQQAVMAIAVFFGEVRLIDNVCLNG